MGLLSSIKRFAGYQQPTNDNQATPNGGNQDTTREQTRVNSDDAADGDIAPPYASSRREIVAIYEDGRLRMFEGRVPVHNLHAGDDWRAGQAARRGERWLSEAIGEEEKDDRSSGEGDGACRRGGERVPVAMRDVDVDPVVGFVEVGSSCSSSRVREADSASSTKRFTKSQEEKIKKKKKRLHSTSPSTSAFSTSPSLQTAKSPRGPSPPSQTAISTADRIRMRRDPTPPTVPRVPASKGQRLTRETSGLRGGGGPVFRASSFGKNRNVRLKFGAVVEGRGRRRVRSFGDGEEEGEDDDGDVESDGEESEADSEESENEESIAKRNAILARFARFQWPARDQEYIESVPELVHSEDELEEEGSAPMGSQDLLQRAQALRRRWNDGKEEGIKSLDDGLLGHLRSAGEKWGGHDDRWDMEFEEISPRAPLKRASRAALFTNNNKETKHPAGDSSKEPLKDNTYPHRLQNLDVDGVPDADSFLNALDECFEPTLLNRRLYPNDGDNDAREEELRNRTLASFDRRSSASSDDQAPVVPWHKRPSDGMGMREVFVKRELFRDPELNAQG